LPEYGHHIFNAGQNEVFSIFLVFNPCITLENERHNFLYMGIIILSKGYWQEKGSQTDAYYQKS
jgi:hypothetical protein